MLSLSPRAKAPWVIGCAALGLSAACMQQDPQSPQVFGGKGAQTSLSERPLPEGAGDPAALGPCGKVGPASQTALIDDFEDGNDRLFKGFERDGFWFGASDKTEGSTISPTGTFAPELIPAVESTRENRYAAHLTASGQKEWGVVWGSALQWTRDGLKCPLNVSAFAGIRFRAKGPGTVRMGVAVPEVTPKDQGGSCDDRCYDAHGKLFLLSDAWDTYEMRWEKMQQGGWGKEAVFTPERVVNLSFNVDVKHLPVDIWIDELELIPKAAPAQASAR
jgi:hypothetical protein